MRGQHPPCDVDKGCNGLDNSLLMMSAANCVLKFLGTVVVARACSRISAFLVTLASLPVRVEHSSGSSLKIADHASRHPPPQCQGHCEICCFVKEEKKISDQIKAVFSVDDNGVVADENINQVPYLQLKT